MTRNLPIPETVTLHVPFRIVKRGGRKEMQVPESDANSLRPDSTLVKALARAFRWKRMLESYEFSTIKEIANHEGIALTYVARILRLTLIEPKMVENILEGSDIAQLNLSQALEPFPVDWSKQTWTDH